MRHVNTEEDFNNWVNNAHQGDQVVYSVDHNNLHLFDLVRLHYDLGKVHLTQRLITLSNRAVIIEHVATRASAEFFRLKERIKKRKGGRPPVNRTRSLRGVNAQPSHLARGPSGFE
jgi:hypothetical protein